MADRLKEYRRRRASGKTPEPMGGRASRKGPIFVVQEHKATSHHFDFRLEVDGVLKSWAVPKGPSTDPRDKRLAMPTEDHPLDYADFEGVIPEDSYGGGAVIVWDRGRYDNITEKDGELQPIAEALEAGHALVAPARQEAAGRLRAAAGGPRRRRALAADQDEGRGLGCAAQAGRDRARIGAERPYRRCRRGCHERRADMAPTIEIDGHKIALSNTDKILFPKAKVSKGDLIDYYRDIAPTMLPHIAGRPLSFQRYPDGIEAGGFMQKNASDYFPDWIRRARLAKEDGEVDHVVAEDAATLVYLANQACVTLHAGLFRIDRIDHPDMMVLDLDPSDDDFAKVKRAAKDARRLLEEVGLTSFVQTTGSRGLHVWVPLDRAARPSTRCARSPRSLAEALAARRPDERTTEQRKAKRGDRVFLDVARNAYGQTVVAPYSVRARPEASVATPLAWEELELPDLEPAPLYRRETCSAGSRSKPDPWAGIGESAQSLAPARSKLAALAG